MHIVFSESWNYFYHFFPIFNLDIFRALILQICIWSIYLVSATPPTVFGESFWNFTVVFRMVWRYAYCFLRILKLFFLHFNLDIFSSLYATDMYREYMPCIGNPAYSFRPILLKLYRYFAAFLWFHMRNLSLAGYNCSGGASCMACSFICIAFKSCEVWSLTLPRFSLSRVLIWRMVTVISWYLMSEVLFSSLQFKFAQCYTWVMKKMQYIKKLLNIFCIVYLKKRCNITTLMWGMLRFPVSLMNTPGGRSISIYVLRMCGPNNLFFSSESISVALLFLSLVYE